MIFLCRARLNCCQTLNGWLDLHGHVVPGTGAEAGYPVSHLIGQVFQRQYGRAIVSAFAVAAREIGAQRSFLEQAMCANSLFDEQTIRRDFLAGDQAVPRNSKGV